MIDEYCLKFYKKKTYVAEYNDQLYEVNSIKYAWTGSYDEAQRLMFKVYNSSYSVVEMTKVGFFATILRNLTFIFSKDYEYSKYLKCKYARKIARNLDKMVTL